MKKQFYIAPELVEFSVELEQGIAQSASQSGYGSAGAAGAAGSEAGSTEW